MNKHIIVIVAIGILGLGENSFGLAFEHIGPVTGWPVVPQPDWPKGIEGIPAHLSRVYSIDVNGNVNFYFKCKVDEINELLAIFARSRMRDHVVRIEPDIKTVSTFSKEEIEYNVRLQIVAGIVLFVVREERRDNFPLEPQLTILTGDNDGAIANQLKWPENVIVESEIPRISINKDNTRPKRDYYYGLLEFADGSPPVEFVKGVNSRITLWEQKEPDGIEIGSVNNKGYFTILLSEAEMADLRKGSTWLTVTIGNWLVKAKKTDMRFPLEMLTREKDKARPVKVSAPSYYYGRILFEDGTPAILDPAPWPGAEIMVSFPYGGPANPDSQGYFRLTFTAEQFEQLLRRKDQRNIYIPDLVQKGRSKGEFTFSPNLLSKDKTKAGVVKIPRPKLPRKELAEAESKIGKPIPGFDNIRFEALNEDRINGKPLLVCFWDFEQRPSRQCIRTLERQFQTWRDKNVVVLAVHSGTTKGSQIKDWLSKNGATLTTGTIQGDPYDTLFAWGARNLPWLVLTDEQHVITKAGFSLNTAKTD